MVDPRRGAISSVCAAVCVLIMERAKNHLTGPSGRRAYKAYIYIYMYMYTLIMINLIIIIIYIYIYICIPI